MLDGSSGSRDQLAWYAKKWAPEMGVGFASLAGKASISIPAALSSPIVAFIVFVIVSSIGRGINPLVGTAIFLLGAVAAIYFMQRYRKFSKAISGRLRDAGMDFKVAPDLRGVTYYRSWCGREGIDAQRIVEIGNLMLDGGQPT